MDPERWQRLDDLDGFKTYRHHFQEQIKRIAGIAIFAVPGIEIIDDARLFVGTYTGSFNHPVKR